MGWIVTAVLSIFVNLALLGLVAFLMFVIRKLYMDGIKFRDEIENRIDDGLNTLDDVSVRLAVIANKPVFFDSPEVREVVRVIKNARDAVLDIAKSFEYITIDDEEADEVDTEVKYVDSDDSDAHKSAEQLDREMRHEVYKNAVLSGKMDVLEPMRSYSHVESPVLQGTNFQQQKYQAALHRHDAVIRKRRDGND